MRNLLAYVSASAFPTTMMIMRKMLPLKLLMSLNPPLANCYSRLCTQ